MNILTLLKTKNHNLHFINRYYRFINQCRDKNQQSTLIYTEKHHILPKAKDMFPEYSCFKNYPNNCVILTYRQYIIAHYILMKAYNNRSQILSFLRTTQKNAFKKCLKIKNINSRIIEKAKIQLSNRMRGVFVRGYDADGIACVSKETKKILSNKKTEFYSNNDNRIKQSIACRGKKRNNTDNIKNAAIARIRYAGDIYSTNLKKTIAAKKQAGTWKRKPKMGLYITPIGVLSQIRNSYRDWCLNPDKKITIHKAKNSLLCNKDAIGKTPRELGFYFITKNDPLFLELYALLNQVHLPLPNHPLSLELNDFLLRENLLPQN